MKINVIDKKIILYIKNGFCYDFNIEKDIEKTLKRIILILKNKFHLSLSGFYVAEIYNNKYYGIIIELFNKEKFEFMSDIIDLKIVINDKNDIYIEVEDYYLLNNYKKVYFYEDKFYINIEHLSYRDLLKLSEFSNYIYGNKLNKIIKKWSLVLK